jgi:hypothetical protein
MDNTKRVTPVDLARAYQEYEQGAQALLDDLERERLEGNDESVRERVREFAETEQKVFLALALALDDTEGFFSEVESHVGRDVAGEFETIRDDYALLAETFKLVRLEVTKERQNPITSIDVRTAYSTEQEAPLVGYTVSSGHVDLHEYRGTTQETLQSAGYFVQAANDALAATLEEDRPVNTDELSELIDRHEKLEAELNTLYDHIDELRRKPVE